MSTDTVIASLQEKIDDLNRQAWEARVNDSPKAFQLSEETVNLARSIDYSKGLAEGLRSLGFGYVRLFKNDEAAPLLRESLSLFKSLNDIKGQAVVYEYLGIIERNWGNLGASLELLLKGYALIQQVGSLEIEVTCCYQIGVTYKHLGNHETALDYLYRALSIAKKSNNALMEAYAINIIGSIYFDNGDYSDSLDCYQRGLVIRQESHDKWGEAGSLDNIGFTYLKLNDLDKAIDYCQQSLQITQATGDKKGEANTLLHLAEIYQQAGEVGQASKFSNESLEIRKARGDKRGEAEVLLFLAELHKYQSDLEAHQLFEWLSGALKIAEEIKAQDLLSKACYKLHEYHTQKGNYKESLVQLEAHLQIEKELHKNTINQKISNLEISHKAEVISQRNKELIELNEKIEKANAELKIEASLERVRGVAMGMKEPADMINVCRMISEQLQQLGFKEIRNVQTAIIYPQKHEYLNYQYFTLYDKESIETIDYRLHPDVLEFTKQMLSSPDAYYHKTFQGEELSVWREYRKKTNQLPDPKLDKTDSSHYYFYSIGSGALGVTTYAPLSEEQIDLFKRFRNVFELAYRRFIDIEKALAQAREAQIEAALERVRAKSMAMHHSDDLISVINVVQEQLLGLGFHFHGANFVTDYNEKGYTMWLAAPGESFPYKIYVPQIGQKYFEAVKEAIEKGVDFATYTLNFEEKNNYFKNLFENTLAKNTSEEGKRMVYESKGMAASVVLLDKIRLNLMNLDLIPFTDEENNILRRFGYVFEQSYTRFLDLQKAEAQAREAQIEAALERVRSRTIAMHKSEELLEVIIVVSEQLQQLKFKFHNVSFGINSKDYDIDFWLAVKGQKSPFHILVPYLDTPMVNRVKEAQKNGLEFFADNLTSKENNQWLKHLFDNVVSDFLTEEIKQYTLNSVGYSRSTAIMKNIFFTIGNYAAIPYSDEENAIFRRFANVFEQSYTRFLDLQKAEAQAREAQTEVALERIRARAMAMHSSNELMDVAHILREQMGLLDQPDLETSVVNLFDEDSDYIQSWHAFREPGSSSGRTINGTVTFRKDSSELTREMIGHYQSGEKEYTLEATGQKLNEFIQVLINSEPAISNYIGKHPPEKVYYHFATFTGGALLTVSYQPTTEDIKSLQRRAASVFDMAYRRYRDLKKAEAQTREAQIEIAVERVRAKALAMHKSEEILSVVVVLRNELLALNIPGVSGTTIYLKQDDGRIRMWDLTSVIELEDGFHLSMDVVFPLQETHPELFIRKIWNATEKYSVQIQNRDDLMRTVEWLGEYKKEEAENVKRFIETSDLRNLFHATVPLANGKLSVDLMEPPSAEMESILQKMATAFDLAYKRFLDLQKAEAQAREAQIETGLERVRSKTMAMHKSEEVTGVAVSLNEELLKLGFEGGSTIIIMDKETGGTEQWTGFSVDKSLKSCYVPYFKHPCHDAQLNAWKKGEEFLVYTVAGNEKRSLDEHYFTTGYKDFPERDKRWMRQMESVTFSHAFMKYGAIHWGPGHLTEEQLRILQRFSKVFEQSYTRFLDLQKAEAQAREAQIEAALERVRSRTMAMYKSDELREVVAVLFTQLRQIGFDIKFCSIALIDKINSTAEFWLAGFSQEILPESYHVPNLDHPFYQNFQSAVRQGIPYQVFELAGQEKRSYDKLWFSLTDFKNLPEPVKRPMMEMERVVLSCAFTKNGMIQIGGFEPLAETDAVIIQRFAKVFEQTYTRFLDLQKAEAQAREAQIEVALERIRARAMAMHSSNELINVANILREQMGLLNQPDLETSVVNLFEEDSELIFSWNASRVPGSLEKIITSTTSFLKNSSELTREMMSLYQSGEKEYTLEAAGLKLMEFLNVLIKANPRVADYIGKNPPEKVFYHFTTFTGGNLLTVSYQPPSEETKSLQRKAASVFDMAYRRYLDLKKAEAQARDAQIEVALERVRAKVMAMTNSNDLNATSLVFGEQLRKLGIDWQFSYFWLVDEAKNENVFWITWPDYKTSFTTYTLAEAEEYFNDCLVSWRAGVKIHDNYVPPEGVKEWIDTFQRIADDAGGEAKKIMVPQTFANGVYYYDAMMKYGSFGICISKPATDEEKKIQCRFAIEFERAYTRFLDLKQAEAQAREAQIEAALERMRAVAMSMKNPDDLKHIVEILFAEIHKLGFTELRNTMIQIYNDALGSFFEYDFSHAAGLSLNTILYNDHPVTENLLRQVRSANDAFAELTISGKELTAWREHRIKTGEKDDPRLENVDTLCYYFYSIGIGTIGISTYSPISEEKRNVLKRFRNVFDLAYKSYIDITKAEAQARESHIQLALERVRARTMAMQKSDELPETTFLLFQQLKDLGETAAQLSIGIIKEEEGYVELSATVHGNQLLQAYHVPKGEPYVMRKAVKAWKEKQRSLTIEIKGQELKEYNFWRNSILEKKIDFPEDQWIVNLVFFSKGMLSFSSNRQIPKETVQLLERFAGVFDLTYTRFLDLKQAEAQAREAQIELGLERVRAKAMAMQKSDELKELIGTVYTELTKLDLILDRCFIMIFDNKSMGVTWWMSNPEAPLQPIGLFVKYHEQPPYQAFIKGWKERNLKWQYVLEGEVKKTWDKFLFVETELSYLPDFVIANMKANEKVYLSASFNNFGCLTLATLESLSDEHFDILLRFAKVFDLTYTRFNDLKQAEAQTREAKIEAALERVRSKAMAMHKSDDLTPAVATVFEELDKLSIGILRCGIAIMDKEKPRGDIWVTVKSEQKSTIQLSGDEPLDYHPLLQGAYDAWLKQEDFSYVLKGEELADYYRAVTKVNFQLPISATFDAELKDQQQFYYNAVFQDGSLFAFMETGIIDEAKMVIKRFANVFNLTYKRFLDLQKAEAQTREAKIEAALERVRARALAMQEPEELKDVAYVLRTEMGLLGVEELETCSIYINDESAEKAECWYALKDIKSEEKKLVNDHFALNLSETWVGREMLQFYQSPKKQISIVMQGENRKEWIRYCEEHSAPFRGYYGDVIPNRTYHLYKFSHGAIGAAAAGDISEESWRMLSRAASVFSLAYSRFKDLTQARTDLIKLKEEKKRAEEALTELQATQKQLIQSEKMASLGELTAGIAHEIQNPLNFVNNFSDVSNELLEEMKQELATGNTQQAIEIVNNVKENLEKILHHGKRADAIVKGMLQHSRSSGGQKELTDINTLAEEYLRLAYHGLRAKDKFFNAKFETDLDPSINKINIVPQEIGRVILNLINNSFYAVSEKKKLVKDGYEPIVTVSTKYVKPPLGGLGVVEIKVKDNGDGIPQKVLDKIFQPFFTTKPTGQGTGLGLSLSYDIITKGHGGEIKVKTREGQGSEFIISLPVN